MKYKCLVLDHDDTVVNSTATIHYPCFVKFLEDFYPHLVNNYTLDSFFEKNFHPGVIALFKDEIGMTDEEMVSEEQYWADFVEHIVPSAYKGMKEIITEFKARGGIVAVVSHSLTRYIERDYRENALPMPDIIYGWDMPKEQRKPSPWCINDLVARYLIEPHEILVVDDLKPGYDMARGGGAHFAAAGWAHNVKTIECFMRQNCDYYFKTVDKLSRLLSQ